MKKNLALIVTLLLAACATEAEPDTVKASDSDSTTTPISTPAETPVSTPAETPVAVEKGVHDVICGHHLDVGCGNYVSIDGKFLEISNGKDMGLGSMEWCSKTDVKAEVAGTITDGVFVASLVSEVQ